MDELCTGCLCTGRILYFIGETGYYCLYTQILNEICVYDTSQICVRVCWECRALLCRLQQFQKQVKSSYTWLMEQAKSLGSPTKPPVVKISHLQIQQVNNISFPQLDVKTETEDLTKRFLFETECVKTEVDDEHCEPETFVNGLDLEVPKKDVKKGKSSKVKSKKKLKNNKKTKIKKKVKEKVKLKRKPSYNASVDNDFFDVHSDVDVGAKETEGTHIDKSEECPATLGTKDEHIENSEAADKLNNLIDKAVRAPPSKEPLPERPQCVECGKTFSSRKTYKYHLNVLHKGQNRYPCPQCGKVYQWKSNLGRHIRSHKARDAGELYCEMCDKRFASVATYRQHLRVSRRHVTESEFSFMCNECGKKFVNKTRLRDHIDWEHLKKIKFKCQLCNKPFKCHTSLYVHMQNVHRNKEKKDNLCHVCGKSYQNAAKLKYHIVAMHTSETPYQCQECNAAFGWYSSLYRHVREVHYKMKVQPKKAKKSKKISNEILLSSAPQQLVVPVHLV